MAAEGEQQHRLVQADAVVVEQKLAGAGVVEERRIAVGRNRRGSRYEMRVPGHRVGKAYGIDLDRVRAADKAGDRIPFVQDRGIVEGVGAAAAVELVSAD